jgi:hypothetical protein
MTKENESENQPTSGPGKPPSISTQRNALFTNPEKLVAMFRDSGNALVRAGFLVVWESFVDEITGLSILRATIVGREGDTFDVATNPDSSSTISFNGKPLT